MNINFHGTEIVCTDHDSSVINAEVKDRDGNSINLFFDSVDDLDLLADELKLLVNTIHEEESDERDYCGDCQGSGMGMTPESRCLSCNGSGEL